MNATNKTQATHPTRPAAKPTPGPWKQEGYGVISENGETEIVIYCGKTQANLEEKRANARLIAKAPDMFSAIQDIISSAQANDANSLAEAINHAERVINV